MPAKKEESSSANNNNDHNKNKPLFPYLLHSNILTHRSHHTF